MTTQVLIVDDDPTLREMIRLILEQAGFNVLEAAHGEAALQLLGSLPVLPGVIVTDLMMPVMGGRELVARLRLGERTAAIPILVLSANVDPGEGLRSAPGCGDAQALPAQSPGGPGQVAGGSQAGER